MMHLHDAVTDLLYNVIMIVLAWIAMLLASTLPDAIWFSITGNIPDWLFWVKACLLVAWMVLSWAWDRARPLRLYFIFLFINILAWWLLPWVRALPFWSQWEKSSPWLAGMLGIQALKFGVALLTIAALGLVFRRRQAYFLVKGD